MIIIMKNDKCHSAFHYEHHHKEVQFQGVRLEDEGFFVCSAFSVAGSLATKAYLEVTAVGNEPPPIIRVGHKPCFVIFDMAASK